MNSLDKSTRSMDAPPALPSAPEEAGEPVKARLAPERPLVSPDRPVGPDDLGRSGDAAFLAQVVLHRRLETPFCLGLFGGAGTGKTFFLNQILDTAERLAGTAGPNGPFVAGAVVARVDAAAPGDPGALLADAIMARLAETHPVLAGELAHAGADLAEAARAANDALNDSRLRHQAERETLQALEGRDAQLIDSALETPGAPLDVYARGRRSSIENALRTFGFEAGEGLSTYKTMVREASEVSGPGSRLRLFAHALVGYRGQTRLLLTGVLFALVAWLLATLAKDATGPIDALRGAGDKGAPLADWAQAHVHWLGPLQVMAVLVCLMCFAGAAWRASRFLRPILTGAGILRQDVEARSRDLQGLLAHQTQRVDACAAEVASATRHASEAERRAAAKTGTAGRQAPASQLSQTQAVLEALTAALQAPGDQSDQGRPGVPSRIVVAIDNLDWRTGEAAAAFVDIARQRLGPGFVCVAAVDRRHLSAGFDDTDPARAAARFERCIQVGYRIDADASDGPTWSALATKLVSARQHARSLPNANTLDPTRSSLDRPWRPRESETLAALSVFAGDSPRAVKRYVNLYRIARADPRLREAPAPVFTALALALALEAHGLPEDLAAMARASQGEAIGDSSVFRRALAVAREISGEPVELGQAQRAIDVAARYSGHA